MSIIAKEVLPLFCSGRYCFDCPFSQDFKPNKFKKNPRTWSCFDACGDSVKERTLLWFKENGGADSALQEASESRGYHSLYIEEIQNWCGYNQGVDFV